MREYVFVFLTALVTTYVLVPLLRTVAIRVGAFTEVRERDVHVVPIPRLGGVAMFLGYAAATLVAWRMPFLRQVFESGELIGILIGAGVVCLVGAIDDVRELDALTKLGGQLVAAAIIAFAGVQALVEHATGESLVHELDALVDAVEHIQQGQILERNRVHDRPGC